MISVIAHQDLQRFRDLVGRRLGFHFDDDRLDQLTDVLLKRLHGSRFSQTAEYLAHLDSQPGLGGEWSAVAAELTVGETHFFRHPDHFAAFEEHVLPQRVQARRAERTLRFLSAGCASGEEAYTLAILLHERLPDLIGWRIEIVGLDINAASLARARRARYSSWSLRGTPEAVQQRCFAADGKDLVLHAAIRALARFEEFNLVQPAADFWQGEPFDAIFCRNVMMYFSPETMRQVVARFAGLLVPGGFLFLGPAETLRGISQGFHLCHTNETFYYQQRASSRAASLPPAANADPRPIEPVLDALAGSWPDAIGQAAARITLLASQLMPPETAQEGVGRRAPGPPPGRPTGAVAPALELLRAERFDEAFEVLHALPPEFAHDADAQLLRAVILTNRSAVSQAEDVCRQVLERDELNAGAHYLLALCREHAADRPSAVEADRMAAYLDPTFAMPHLHLGLLAKRSGDRETARREFQQAVVLLEREDAARILLLGGGFSRESLVQLCQAELRLLGGVP
ncbi:MAG: protein-glutamate O-methyltransferase CheR [Planctomycetia bacterium]|nr:protein-glutamate O-methyltransferase CheR [Planctomycetia bacterium]